LKRGARVAVRGPVGSFVFPPRLEERHLLFVAGGTGIAPLRSMICHAFHTPHLLNPAKRVQDSGTVRAQIRLLYSARTPRDFAYLAELRRYARAGLIELALNATREVPPRWRGARGRITRDRLEALVETPATLCFVCGPVAMVDEVPRMLQSLGIDPKRIRIEEW
jgi:ferredoxin-NADP reductase